MLLKLSKFDIMFIYIKRMMIFLSLMNVIRVINLNFVGSAGLRWRGVGVCSSVVGYKFGAFGAAWRHEDCR